MKKSFFIVLLLMLLSGCGTSNAHQEPKSLDEIIHQFEYNDYSVYYSFLISNPWINFKTNGDCFDFKDNNGVYSVNNEPCPVRYNGMVSFPSISAKRLTGSETMNDLYRNKFSFGSNGYSYNGLLNDGSETFYTYDKELGENPYSFVSFYDNVKKENYRYIISGTPKENDLTTYGTLSKTGEDNCKEFYKQYQTTLKELGLSEQDMDSFFQLYYETYIKDNEEKINNEYQLNYSDEDCYNILLCRFRLDRSPISL